MQKFRFYSIFLILFFIFVPLSVIASARMSKQLDHGRALVDDVAFQVLEIINTPGLTDSQVKQKFRELIIAKFAVDPIIKFVLGKHNQTMTPEQKEVFVRCFKNMLVGAYASNFKDYKSAKFRIVSIKKKTDTLLQVTGKISDQGKADILMIWEVAIVDEQYKIRDISVDGVSILQILRAQTQASISEKGLKSFLLNYKERYWELL
ncbi:MAG: ABC transporter substrate-binding protein [Holosporaceae bacterium]|jgi:ABC-type transporter MlaC component|nr:ABC transporter substrate-binding protein [Holosporaceae bacterium]